MDRIIKKILDKIEDEGFEAYLVGGFVRDYLLGKKSYDVDICTNALPKDLHRIFPVSNNSNNYGGFNLKVKQYNVDITTYRKEINYENRKPTEVIYINNLLEDLKRRDFTINALCMGLNEKIIDPLEAISDIHSRIIKMIGDIDKKFQEDPLRILRAIRFSTILDFDIDIDLWNGIKKSAHLVHSLSGVRIKEELNPILLSDNYQRGIDLLRESGIADSIGMKVSSLVKCSDINMMWAQIECNKIPFTKVEKDYILKIREIVSIGTINNETMYKYGLYLNMAVAEYFGIDKKRVSNIYKQMPIKNIRDLAINSSQIIEILNIKPSKKVSDVQRSLVHLVLNKKIKNNKKDLKRWLEQNKGKWQDE